MCMNFSSRGLKEAVVNSYYSDAFAHSDSLDRHFVARTIYSFKVPWILSRNERLPVVNLTETLRNNLLCKSVVAICSCCIIPHFARRIHALCHFPNPLMIPTDTVHFFFNAVSHLSHSNASTCLQMMRWNYGVRIPIGARNFSFSITSRPRLGPTQRPFLWVLGFVSGVSGLGVELATELRLVPRLRMSGASPLLPLFAYMAWTGKFYLLIPKRSVSILKKTLRFHYKDQQFSGILGK